MHPFVWHALSRFAVYPGTGRQLGQHRHGQGNSFSLLSGRLLGLFQARDRGAPGLRAGSSGDRHSFF